ncbi:107aa long hypothetical protein [Pyrococcus horikoshii OT3]|uniref:Uncharacterized protein n=1 Tax=Pyrococcus horikoshii (strain ATCC 700860 / DSM 12428 / JCM 9974 / NBRC 100139 / OT-3) TaxID=70601 RepID=O57730_PYRHO|nr:107aa long hypothetical protein [Pyrococcus horikoshii OT3]
MFLVLISISLLGLTPMAISFNLNAPTSTWALLRELKASSIFRISSLLKERASSYIVKNSMIRASCFSLRSLWPLSANLTLLFNFRSSILVGFILRISGISCHLVKWN